MRAGIIQLFASSNTSPGVGIFLDSPLWLWMCVYGVALTKEDLE